MSRDRSEGGFDPVQILATKLDFMVSECSVRHRRLDDEIHDLRVIIHGESGDNGLKSIIARQEKIIESLKDAQNGFKSKMDALDKRVLAVVVGLTALSAAMGAGTSTLLNMFLKHL